MSEPRKLLANGRVIKSHGPWQLIRDDIAPYCWLIKCGHRHLRRFIWEDEARDYYTRMIELGEEQDDD